MQLSQAPFVRNGLWHAEQAGASTAMFKLTDEFYAWGLIGAIVSATYPFFCH